MNMNDRFVRKATYTSWVPKETHVGERFIESAVASDVPFTLRNCDMVSEENTWRETFAPPSKSPTIELSRKLNQVIDGTVGGTDKVAIIDDFTHKIVSCKNKPYEIFTLH